MMLCRPAFLKLQFAVCIIQTYRAVNPDVVYEMKTTSSRRYALSVQNETKFKSESKHENLLLHIPADIYQ